MDIGNVKSVMDINLEVWSEIVWCKQLLIKNEAVLGHLTRGERPIPFKKFALSVVHMILNSLRFIALDRHT